MKPRKPNNEPDLFRAQLSQILNLRHPLLRLSEKMDWARLEAAIDVQYRPGPGQPPLPTRLMAGLHYLKYAFDLSDERLVARWLENPYWQYFCGYEYLQHELPLHPTSLVRWRERMGDRLESLLEHSLHVARQEGLLGARELERVRRGHDGAGEGGGVPNGCAAVPEDAPGAGDAGALRAGAADAAGGAGDAPAEDLAGPGGAGHRAQAADGRGGAAGAAASGEAPAGAAAARFGQAVQRACAGGGVHRQGQGAPALRIRLQGVAGDDLEGKLAGGGGESGGEPLRRAYAGRGPGPDRTADRAVPDACVLRPRIPGARGRGRHAGPPGREDPEEGDPDGTEVDEAARRDRTDHRAPEVGSSIIPEPSERVAGRPGQRGAGGGRVQFRQAVGRVFPCLEKIPGNFPVRRYG